MDSLARSGKTMYEMLEHSIQEGVCRMSSPMTPSQEEALEWLRYVGACHERGTPALLGGRGQAVEEGPPRKPGWSA